MRVPAGVVGMSAPRKPLTPDDERHGTIAGASAHRREKSPLCDSCREVARNYMREFRATHPDLRKRERRTNKARSRALWRLADLHPDDFQRLVLDELRRDPARRPVS